MTDEITKVEPEDKIQQAIETALMKGDLGLLPTEARVAYVKKICDDNGLNMMTRPFQWITLNNKLTLYATRDCTDQLRKIHKVSIEIMDRVQVGDAFIVRARATTPDGRQDESIGGVGIGGMSGEVLANAMMKAETKSKRRVTLSICGLGFLDEMEVQSISPAQSKEEGPRRISAPPPAWQGAIRAGGEEPLDATTSTPTPAEIPAAEFPATPPQGKGPKPLPKAKGPVPPPFPIK